MNVDVEYSPSVVDFQMMKSSCILLICVLAVQAQEASVRPATSARVTSIRSTSVRATQPNQTVFVTATSIRNAPQSTNRNSRTVTQRNEDTNEDSSSNSESSTSSSSSTTSTTTTSTSSAASDAPSLPASLPAESRTPASGAINQVAGTLFLYTGLLVGYFLY